MKMNIKIDYTENADGWNNGVLEPKGIMVHSTATPGIMAQAFRDRWDRPNVGASIHAFLDDKEIVQCLPWTKKAGHAGGSANSTHIGFEICEPGGFRYEGGSKMVGYDAVEQQPYFNAIWKNSVELCAYLCRMFSLDPLEDGVIITHSEGYERGIASNHGDVMHWFPKHNRDMDDFRQAVKKQMDMEVEEMNYEKFLQYMERYNTELMNAEPDQWSEEARKWAESEGIIKGIGDGKMGYKLPLTREQYVEMEYRQIIE